MAKALYHTIFILFFYCSATAQATFKGKVLNAATKEPLAGASVYFNNTSYGTSTNEAGEFSIPFPAIANPELVISSVGYEILLYKVKTGEDITRPYSFILTAKEALLQDVLVLPDATRRKFLKNFTDNFVGMTEEAATSTLKNIPSIYFTKEPGDQYGFKAFCDTPLIIVNKMLGYRVYFQLQQFYYNESTGFTSFYGYTRYEEMGDKKRWIKNRRKAYYGSTMHFFRSLVRNQLNENSFKVFVVKTDTLRYKDGSTKQMDMAIPTTAGQLVRKDSGEIVTYHLSWKDKLMVQYFKEPASKLYLSQHNFVNGSLTIGFRSYLHLKEGSTGIDVDSQGIILNAMDVLFGGYWIYEKAANLLPFDYNPENN